MPRRLIHEEMSRLRRWDAQHEIHLGELPPPYRDLHTFLEENGLDLWYYTIHADSEIPELVLMVHVHIVDGRPEIPVLVCVFSMTRIDKTGEYAWARIVEDQFSVTEDLFEAKPSLEPDTPSTPKRSRKFMNRKSLWSAAGVLCLICTAIAMSVEAITLQNADQQIRNLIVLPTALFGFVAFFLSLLKAWKKK